MPEIAPAISAQVNPLSVLFCHCTVGVGIPIAVDVKIAVVFAQMLNELGLVTTVGANNEPVVKLHE